MLKLATDFVLTAVEFERFATIIENVKMPTGHVLAMAQYIRRKLFGGLKSHDYHVLMQQILLLALRGLLGSRLQMAIMRVYKVFRRLCSKVWDPSKIHSLQIDVAISLSLMEMHFPPSFFDIMMHLLYHLVDGLDLCGPIATRWMYPMERYMKAFKLYVRNMARLEASMAKGYVRDDCLGFITEYLQRFDVMKEQVWDVDEEEGDAGEVLEEVGKKFHMTPTLHDLAHEYVLTNMSVMTPWM